LSANPFITTYSINETMGKHLSTVVHSSPCGSFRTRAK